MNYFVFRRLSACVTGGDEGRPSVSRQETLRFGVPLLAGLLLIGCQEGANYAVTTPPSQSSGTPDGDASDFRTFKEGLQRDIDGFYLVEGDMRLMETQLKSYYDSRGSSASDNALIVLKDSTSGKWSTWDVYHRYAITYCISADFGTSHGDLKDKFASAARAWTSNSGIGFIYMSSENGACNQSNANVNLSVFPHVFSDPSTLADGSVGPYVKDDGSIYGDHIRVSQDHWDDQAGSEDWKNTRTLSHELGHILGFKHEHSHYAEGNNCNWPEDDIWEGASMVALDSHYDALSIMSYCAGAEIEDDYAAMTKNNYIISPGDKKGAREVYAKHTRAQLQNTLVGKCVSSTLTMAACGGDALNATWFLAADGTSNDVNIYQSGAAFMLVSAETGKCVNAKRTGVGSKGPLYQAIEIGPCGPELSAWHYFSGRISGILNGLCLAMNSDRQGVTVEDCSAAEAGGRLFSVVPSTYSDSLSCDSSNSYSRGLGSIPENCPSGWGYGGAGVCWENCRSGYTDTGALCSKCSGDWRPWTWKCDTYAKSTAGAACASWEGRTDKLCYSHPCPYGFSDVLDRCYRRCGEN